MPDDMTRRSVKRNVIADKICGFCGATFTRQEHLTRHEKSHTRVKPFKCAECGKSFSRQDVLGRHRLSHRLDRRPVTGFTHPRACKQCASSRTRCSRAEPCKRCAERSLVCTYPTTGPSKVSSADVMGVGTDVDIQELPVTGATPVLSVSPLSEQYHNNPGRTPAPENPDIINNAGPDIDGPRSQANCCVPPAGAAPRNAWPTPAQNIPAIQTPSSNAQVTNADTPHLVVGLNQQAVDLLSMNWMSPGCPGSVVWDGLMPPPPDAMLDYSGIGNPFAPPIVAAPTIMPGPVSRWATNGEEQDLNGSAHLARPELPPYNPAATKEPGTLAYPRTEEYEDRVSGAGGTYTDGAGSRAPFHGQTTQRRSGWRGVSTVVALPSGSSASNFATSLVNLDSYNNMVLNLQPVLSNEFPNMSLEAIPTLECTLDCVQSFFDMFYPIFPFIRMSSFLEDSSNNWALLLAIIVVGSKYIPSRREAIPRDRFTRLLNKVSRERLYATPIEKECFSTSPLECNQDSHFDLPALQVATLNLICALHAGRQYPLRHALLETHLLVGACNDMKLLSPVGTKEIIDPEWGSVVPRWVDSQSRIRTGLMIWLLDATVAFEFGTTPLMQLVDAKVPLPCVDRVWEHPSIDSVLAEGANSVTLIDAVETLYMEKRLPEKLSDFGANLLIHSIWRRTKDVIKQNETRLAAWTPCADIHVRIANPEALKETWPPSSPILSNWRNSACDCLDILHWQANSKTASAGGLEQPTVMYLHLSRLLLLTPVAHVQTVATSPERSNPQQDGLYAEARNHVLTWAICDPFKARLAVIHAGALFWHVRRYSRNSFLEPFAIYLATLVLWAYSISVQSVKPLLGVSSATGTAQAGAGSWARSLPDDPQPVGNGDEEKDAESEPFFFYIDRPCDDEMVQRYLRVGQKLAAYMTRVGVISAIAAPGKIIQEGLRLLMGEANYTETEHRSQTSTVNLEDLGDRHPWGIEESYIRLLIPLAGRRNENMGR